MNTANIKKRYKIIIGILFFLIIILFAIPRIARLYIVNNGNKLISRNLTIKKIRINYFTGAFLIEDLQLFEANSKDVFLSFGRLKVNIDYIPLFKNEFYVKNIMLEDPYIQVLQEGDKFNFSDMTASDSATVVKDTIPEKPTKYIINDIRINRGLVKYTDVTLNHTIALNKLDLMIPGFTWNSDSTNLNVNFTFVDGGGLYSSFALNQADSSYSINLKLDSLNLDIIEPYVQNSMYISALHGFLSNDVLIKGNMQSVMQLFVKGVNHIYGFQLLDTLNRTVLSFNDLTIDIESLQLDKNKIKLNYVGMTDPFILFEMIDSSNNLVALMKPTINEQPDSLNQNEETTAVAGEGSFEFSKLLISGGKIQFSDKTLNYPFDYTIDNLIIESAPIVGRPGKLSLKVSAGLNGTGSFNANGILNPSDFNDMDLKLSIGQLRMKDMDAYFKHYFGFPVTGGIMNFQTDNEIRPSSLTSDNNIFFRKFTLAESMHTKVEYKLPLRLALGVLSDKDGIIDLKAPVESKGSEIKVKNLGKIIFKVIGNLFIKAAVSPFNALSGSYNVDASALQEIQLSLTEDSPDVKNMKSIDIISDIISKKPGLNVDFYYCIDRIKASDSLAYMLAVEDYRDYNKSIGVNVRDIADSTLTDYLANKTTSVSLQKPTNLTALCANYIGEERLNFSLDSIRTLQTGFITNYLSHDKAISADRFNIILTPVDTIRPSGNYPAFRIYFTAGATQD